MDYDPEIAPNPAEWLSLDEQERIDLIEDHHKALRIKLPNAKAHAVFHAIVENQIAEGLESVARAMVRLQREGLSRHDALHAISSVAAEYVYELMNSNAPGDADTALARYNAAVERLTAKTWRDQYGAQD